MKKILIILGMSAGSGVGWWLGAKVGFMTGYLVSTIGAGIGLYLSQRFVRNNML